MAKDRDVVTKVFALARIAASGAASVAVSGCSFTLPPDEQLPVDGAPQPDTQAVDDDRDGDGVKNDADNCPDLANADQGNEDGDARGDACDLCPQLAAEGAALDADGDADGVGDACDPHATTPGDALVRFDGFHTASASGPQGFDQIHGSAALWSIAGDELVFTRNGDDWNIIAFDTTKLAHTVDATFEITNSFTPQAQDSASAAGVVVDVDRDDRELGECQARTDFEQRELWRWTDRGAQAGWTRLALQATQTPNDTYRIVLTRGADLSCTTTRGGANLTVSAARGSDQNTRAGVFARNVNVKFKYIAIYTSP